MRATKILQKPRKDNSNSVIIFQQANSNHQNNESEEIKNTFVEVLTSISCRTSSTETAIVPEKHKIMIE